MLALAANEGAQYGVAGGVEGGIKGGLLPFRYFVSL